MSHQTPPPFPSETRASAAAMGACLVALALVALMVLGGCGDDGDTTPRGDDAGRSDSSVVRGDGSADGTMPTADGSGPRADGGARAADSSAPKADAGSPASPSSCAPLGPANGATINVTPKDAAKLPQIVAGAKPGTTILLADGTYRMSGGESSRRLQFHTAGVTLRSASGKRDKVIIDGEYKTLEIITVDADDVTIADLTIRRAVDHLVHVTGGNGKNTLRTRLWNLRLEDSGEQFVKVNPSGSGTYVDDGRLECSLLRMSATGRANVEPNPGGCYTGGIDAHAARGWIVRKNRFEGIHCRNGAVAEHAVHFWSTSRGTLVEQNIIVDCARGVGFGLRSGGTPRRSYSDNPYSGAGYLGHIDGVIRNNLIVASGTAAQFYDTGIELSQARGAAVYHNTVASKPTFSSIDYRFGNTRVTIQNNLVHRITRRDGAGGTVSHNGPQPARASFFVDPAGGDWRLATSASAAIDKGRALGSAAGRDLDGRTRTRGAGPDLGAYER